LDTTAFGVLSIPVQTKEVGMLKKYLSPAMILLVLLVALLPLTTGCNATGAQTSATIYGSGTDKMSNAAKIAEEALAAITKSPIITTPGTVQNGKLSIGSDSAYPPLEFLAKVITIENAKNVETIQLVGFEVDLCRAVAKKLGLEPTFLTVDLSEVPSALTEGRVDIVASAMITNTQLMAEFSATDAYLAADLAICTKTSAPLADEAALAGKTVAVQAGSAAQSVVGALASVGKTSVYPHILNAFADLDAGKVDAVVIEQPVALWIMANHADYAAALKISGAIKSSEGYALWCEKDKQDLLAAINAAMLELRVAPIAAPQATTTTAAAIIPTTGAATSTTAPAGGATTTSVPVDQSAKSVYQLLCEKWGLTGN
jgi:polar amino acid transport system substrate-binding protein